MDTILPSIFALLILLQIKHMFADYFMQTRWMLAGRGQFLHPGRAAHCAIHAVLTAACLVLVGTSPGLLLVIVLAEWAAHYLIDFSKGWWSERQGHGPTEAGYWRAFGADQTLHQLTYVVMLWVWATAGAGG